MEEFDTADSYKFWLEIILSILSVISLICACLLTRAIRRTRYIAQQQAQLALSMDISMDNLLNNSADYALTEFVILMSMSDVFRSLIKTFRHFRSAFSLWTLCDLSSVSGIICLIEDFITWSLISNDIICYAVICFCLFRYLRKRSIFTTNAITPKRIHCSIISLSTILSTIQTILVVVYYHNHFNYHIIYIPSLILLYCTVFYILSVFTYIRCCHPFWILSKSNKSQYLFLVVFIIIFIIPITLKMFLSTLPSSHTYIMSYISDVLLTQTGTGNFFAWYYSQTRNRITEMKNSEKLFHNEESVELGSDIEYVIDVKELRGKNKDKNNKIKKKSTFVNIFSSPNSRKMSDDKLYKPPTLSIDVMAMEPVSKTSNVMTDVSYSDNIDNQLFVNSSQNIFTDW
eukprot:485856_1